MRTVITITTIGIPRLQATAVVGGIHGSSVQNHRVGVVGQREISMNKRGHFTFVGSWYDVEIKELPTDVDVQGRKAIFGQIDTWDQVCRLYHLPKRDAIRKSLLHEVMHLIVDFMRSNKFDPPDAEIDQMSELWYDFLDRNKLIVENWGHVIPTERIDE